MTLLLAPLLWGLLACVPGDGEQEASTCDVPTSVDPFFTVEFEVPEGAEDFVGDCTVVDNGAAEGLVTLDLECAGVPATLTVPGDAPLSGLELGETLSMDYRLPSEANFSSATTLTLSDDEGFVIVGFRSIYDRITAGPLEFEFDTNCAEVHLYDESAEVVDEAAGFIRVSGDDVVEVGVDEPAMVRAGGLDFEVFVSKATGYNCCHGDLIGATGVRR